MKRRDNNFVIHNVTLFDSSFNIFEQWRVQDLFLQRQKKILSGAEIFFIWANFSLSSGAEQARGGGERERGRKSNNRE